MSSTSTAHAWKLLLGGGELLLHFSWPRRKEFRCLLSSHVWKEPSALKVVLLLPLFLLLPSQLLLTRLLFPLRPRRPVHPPWFRPPLLRPPVQLPWFRPLLLSSGPLLFLFRPLLLVLFRPPLLALGFPHRPFLALSTFSIAPQCPMVSAVLGARLSMPRCRFHLRSLLDLDGPFHNSSFRRCH